MRKSFTALALGAVAVLSAAAQAGGAGWYADFDEAAAAAKQDGKDLFVDFTGSDWCGWCIKLDEEVFSHDEFLEAVQKDFVLVALDFPKTDEVKAKVPNPKRNEELQQEHGVRGFPTVLLMNADGEVFASTGYRPGGPEEYLKHLSEITESGRKALKETQLVLEAFEAAEGEAKIAAWERAVALLETLDADSPFAAQLAAPVRFAFEADPQNERGLKLRAVKVLLKAGQVDEVTTAAGRELDPKNEHGILELLVQTQFMQVRDDETAKAALDALDELSALGIKDSDLAFELNFTAARWCSGPLQDEERCKKYALAAKEVGSENEEMMKSLEELLNG